MGCECDRCSGKPGLGPITAGSKVVVTKGCADRLVRSGTVAIVKKVEAMGADYNHAAKVVLALSHFRSVVFYARHPNRLSDPEISMNDGNPLHKIKVRRA
jgi:hypothetical protein